MLIITRLINALIWQPKCRKTIDNTGIIPKQVSIQFLIDLWQSIRRTQIVCAWGSCGAASGTSGVIGDVIITPAFAPDCVVDTLGAGDTFIGGLIHAQIHRASLLSAVNFACRVAGHKVGSYGYDCLRDFTRNESRTKQSRTFVMASCWKLSYALMSWFFFYSVIIVLSLIE